MKGTDAQIGNGNVSTLPVQPYLPIWLGSHRGTGIDGNKRRCYLQVAIPPQKNSTWYIVGIWVCSLAILDQIQATLMEYHLVRLCRQTMVALNCTPVNETGARNRPSLGIELILRSIIESLVWLRP